MSGTHHPFVETTTWLGVGGLLVIAGCAGIAGLGDYTGPGGSTSVGASGGSGGVAGATTSSGGTSAGGGGAGGGCLAPEDCPAGENGQRTCINGICGFQCAANYDDCDDLVGCEADLRVDKNHCGDCNTACSASCAAKVCIYPSYIAAGYEHTCAVMTNGDAYCWGHNQQGELGDGTGQDRHTPTRIALSGPASQIAGSGRYQGPNNYVAHSCALLADKTVQCWGSNDYGQLGIGNTTSSTAPVAIQALSNVQQLAVGGSHTCALNDAGTLLCWGHNDHGQLGTGQVGELYNEWTPHQIMTGVASVAAGMAHTCVTKANLQVWCWGSNSDGQLGINSTVQQPSPVQVTSVAGNEIRCGLSFTCVRSNFGAGCWGDNVAGQIGDNTQGNDRLVSATLSLNGIGQGTLELGDYHSTAIVAGTVYVWGENADGQLGDGTLQRSLTPKALTGLDPVTMVSAGSLHTCALTSGNVMKCWGSNLSGQLGDGSVISKSAPVDVVWP